MSEKINRSPSDQNSMNEAVEPPISQSTIQPVNLAQTISPSKSFAGRFYKLFSKWFYSRFDSLFDSLFARIFLLQVTVGILLTVIFVVLLFNEQANIFAHSTAPLWAQALKPVQQNLRDGQPARLPNTKTVTADISLIPGPPPFSASPMPLVPRYRALISELNAQGIPVISLAVSGETGNTTTWLELQTSAQPVWVGVQSELEGPDIRRRGLIGFLIVVLVFIVASAWLSRRIARPLLDLQRSVKAFAAKSNQPHATSYIRSADIEKAAKAANTGPAEVRQLAAQFAEFAAQRAEQDTARDLMLAAISHDLRSPLARIRMAAELLPETSEVNNKRDSIVRNVQIADKLVGSFLDLARAEAEPMEERVDLCALTQRLLSAGDYDHVSLSVESSAALWIAPASSIAIERMLANLLDNATKYGQAPVLVRLYLQETKEQKFALLAVRDHGTGIAADQRDLLRKPFSRGAQDRGLPGTGLGLAIVERTMQRHGGKMLLQDAAPGLQVLLFFPLA
ncbi:ATP-binding protein [Undibacterium sp. RTI2.1]|uniref:ATP-binding protein n=1 Tax=unclassified Undibacterium TaxID=2630295 RepID=UPI002B224E68|nr:MULTISPECIES: ATP-binding protein [unclassified Undibacterium]MEB0029986.1 ATP-binding protein [Undibacterium sp. RTI2.1]MEB0117050.1 ATP-binding protein [Undibacterium sp. RTI2.2]